MGPKIKAVIMTEPDLTPTESPLNLESVGETTSKKKGTKKKIIYGVVLAAILSGFIVVLVITLAGEALFFRNVDEAVSLRTKLGDERFRIQGITVPDTIDKKADIVLENGERVVAISFQIAFNGATANVIYRGELAAVFTNCLPVILEGHWSESGENSSVFKAGDDGYYFDSREMLVKHDNNYILPENDDLENVKYKSENPNRIDDAVGEINNHDPLSKCPQV